VARNLIFLVLDLKKKKKKKKNKRKDTRTIKKNTNKE